MHMAFSLLKLFLNLMTIFMFSKPLRYRFPSSSQHWWYSYWHFTDEETETLTSSVISNMFIILTSFRCEDVSSGQTFFFFKYLFIWLCQALVVACEIFSCGTWDLVPWPGIKPRPYIWEHRVLAIRLPGKSSSQTFLSKVFWNRDRLVSGPPRLKTRALQER